ncbi:hypothetical protein BRARA_H01093 [Brassica rapa]|uniref:Uncharacterized protein n=3 Tax=Brassica TaxID=3705 RepID=A0A397YAN4_BRACM|nr:15.4 kDa class V heat shock protein [Brassica rapa]XP_013654831.1 15.4 kDa class V heat shock protein [Brassica napus]KAG5389628.1 hypothetical protein IGI04_031169 [Brassica rapa subsp. trilocularis]KAH0915167.1 hypothetical protein HID58_029613 [Brassica napus]RID50357.1 hypothetical protein BRARA_H01093 [Brassica rapa]CAF2237555.1 unnamed protein product [Brassica napus]CAG7898077.1 unnamed protein product [Brassica rapa]
MDSQTIQPTLWECVQSSQSLSDNQTPQQNRIRWSQSPDSHTFSVDLPGLRKEDIKVEIEDSIYLIIRTKTTEISPVRSLKRKFRLPESIDMIGITANYEDGVLTVIVPKRVLRRRSFFIDPSDVPQSLHVLARAA